MVNNSENTNNQIYVPIIMALLLVAIVVALVWVGQIRPAIQAANVNLIPAEAQAPESTGQTSAEAKPGVDVAAAIAAVNKGGCAACHTIPGIPGAEGQVGPNLSRIGVDGATRIDGYTAADYIRESIKNPTAFTAPKCPTGPCVTGMMPQIQLDDTEVEALVSYLATLGVN